MGELAGEDGFAFYFRKPGEAARAFSSNKDLSAHAYIEKSSHKILG